MTCQHNVGTRMPSASANGTGLEQGVHEAALISERFNLFLEKAFAPLHLSLQQTRYSAYPALSMYSCKAFYYRTDKHHSLAPRCRSACLSSKPPLLSAGPSGWLINSRSARKIRKRQVSLISKRDILSFFTDAELMVQTVSLCSLRQRL